MEHLRSDHTNSKFNNVPNPHWLLSVFNAKACERGGTLRRAIRDVHREVGREAFIDEIRRRGWHLIESGDQYIVICNDGALRGVC